MKNSARAEITAKTNQLINISQAEINGEIVQVVNARDLHSKLGSKRQFTNWIEDRIKKYGFEENRDFNKIVKPQENNKKEYILTLDTAKEIAMVENNEKGREIRKYFIEIEKKFKIKLQEEVEKLKLESDRVFNNPSPQKVQEIMIDWYIKAQMYEQNQKEIKALKQKIKDLENKQQEEIKKLKQNLEQKKLIQTNIASLGTGELLMSIGDFAKELGVSRRRLFEELRHRKFLKLDNKPYKRYLNKLFVVKDTKYLKADRNYNYKQTFITADGIIYLKSLLGNYFASILV